MSKFESVTVVKAANIYFDGNVTSRTVEFADGTIKTPLFTPDNIHLSLDGYAVYAERLKPLLDKFLGRKGLGGDGIIPAKK